MWLRFVLSTLSVIQAAGDAPDRGPRDRLEAVLDRASKATDLDEAALVLSSLLSDEPALRAAFLSPTAVDERSLYILFGGAWGPRAKVTWKDGQACSRIRTSAVSAKTESIRAVLRADRYETFLWKPLPHGAATINFFPFFAHSQYADDLAEIYIETLRKDVAHPAEPIRSPFGGRVILTAEQVEENLLGTWQMLCGLCGRLDLIDRATTENWRGRFAKLDEWFKSERPFIIWDDVKSCIRIDEDAKELAIPTPRSSRLIPELVPPWLPEKKRSDPPDREEKGLNGMP